MHEIKDIKVAVIKENGTKKYQPRIENYVGTWQSNQNSINLKIG